MKNRSIDNSGIYVITNISTKKVYIGSSSNLSRRKREHISLLEKGTHGNVYLQYAWNKHGKEDFKVFNVEIGVESSVLYERERFWIDSYKSLDSNFGYNLSYPSDNNGVITHSESTKELLRRKAFEYYHKDEGITYEEWKAIKELPKVYCDITQGKHLYLICIKTGEIIQEFKSLVECGEKFSVSYKTIQKVVDVLSRSFKGYRVVSVENYNKNINYIKKNNQGRRLST